MRVDPKRAREVPWYLKPFFWRQRRKYGRHLEPALVWAHSPRVFLGVALLYGMIDRRSSPLSPSLRSLLTVRVSQLNGCAFCVDLNTNTLMDRGVSEEKALAVQHWQHSGMFTEEERVALAYAEAVTQSPAEIPDSVFDAPRQQFDTAAIVDLTGLIAFQNLSSKFNSALAVPSQGFCQIPENT